MKKLLSKEVKIGIAFVASIFILYYGINFLKGINIFKPTNSYIVVFDDVTDLTLSSPVLINGFQVGLVYSMELTPDNKVATVLNLNKGVEIPKGSKVSMDVSLLGSASVIIELSPYADSNYSSTDTIPGTKVPSLMKSMGDQVVPQLSVMLPKVDSILGGLQTLINHPALIGSLQNMEQITANLETSSRQLNSLMLTMNRDVPAITGNVATISKDMAGVTSQFKSMNFVSTYQSVDSTLRNVQTLTTKLTAKDNSFGLLLNDRALYDSLSTTIGNASLLLQDVKENPKRYINVKVF